MGGSKGGWIQCLDRGEVFLLKQGAVGIPVGDVLAPEGKCFVMDFVNFGDPQHCCVGFLLFICSALQIGVAFWIPDRRLGWNSLSSGTVKCRK